MENKKLKLLAEWYYEGKVTPDNIWSSLDSNQLDMLEDKMIEDIGQYALTLRFVILRTGKYKVDVFDYSEVYASGKGKTKNKARLNAIISYVEQKL